MSVLHRRIVGIVSALLVSAAVIGSPGAAKAEELESLSPEAAVKPQANPNQPVPPAASVPESGAAKTGAPKSAGVRTLSEVPIHGELGVTQILFITGRDQHRYFDFLIARYLQDASALAADLVLPRSVGPADLPAASGAAGAAQEPRTSPEGQ